MENIIPRWEWRTFGESFGEADNRFAALEAAGTQESDEIYFLSPAGDQNVKVRDKLMDIKTLEHVNPDGLEQWKPVMKGTFPLPAAEVKKVFEGAQRCRSAIDACRLHARPVHRRTREARRPPARGECTQEADPLQD